MKYKMCEKCGGTYDSRNEKCPKCGHKNKKTMNRQYRLDQIRDGER